MPPITSPQPSPDPAGRRVQRLVCRRWTSAIICRCGGTPRHEEDVLHRLPTSAARDISDLEENRGNPRLVSDVVWDVLAEPAEAEADLHSAVVPASRPPKVLL